MSAIVLRIVLPKGSLERATMELFEAADLNVIRPSSVEYRATIDDPRVAEVRVLRPQEIPDYVAEGPFLQAIRKRMRAGESIASLSRELRMAKVTIRECWRAEDGPLPTPNRKLTPQKRRQVAQKARSA